MKKGPLFSVVILCYRHFKYLFSALDSVLEQDYSNIELIVSDDCSANFPEKKITTYIEERKSKNITSVMIRQQEKNSGTVKHLNSAIKACSGKYIIALAGDDNLYDKRVLTNYVRGFEEAPPDCLIEMAHTAMYDEDMDRLLEYYMTPEVQRAIEKTETDSSDLLRLLIRYGACLPSTSTCFTKEFFHKYGEFDERFTLVEDYPMHVRLAEEGWTIHCCNFVAIKHRSGGISHGQSDTLSHSARLYYADTENMLHGIMLKKIDFLQRKERMVAQREIDNNLQWTRYQLAKGDNIGRKSWALLASPQQAITKLLHHISAWTATKSQTLIAIFLILWIITPLLGHMADTIYNGTGIFLMQALYFLTGICCGIWIIRLSLSFFARIILSVKQTPGGT